MSLISNFISLKNYIPIGQPKLSDFILKAKEIKLENNNENTLVKKLTKYKTIQTLLITEQNLIRLVSNQYN